MRINFVLNPAPKISGGPLAILDYANGLTDLGHDVSITTYPNSCWAGEDPFPWYSSKGKIYFADDRKTQNSFNRKILQIKNALSSSPIIKGKARSIMRWIYNNKIAKKTQKSDEYINNKIIQSMPECDLNIATWWKTAYAVFKSGKGKPVYFMQHFEPLFYEDPLNEIEEINKCLGSYRLPMYKVANSSWLKSLISNNYGGDVRFSNNGFTINDFSPSQKDSAKDGIIRIITYCRPEEWKGFSDAHQALEIFSKNCNKKLIWNIFGYQHQKLNSKIPNVDLRYYPKLSFNELASLYSKSDIALCPSWYESFPLPPLEAMASKTAVITTRLGTEDFAFDGKNSLVVSPRNLKEMVAALQTLIDNPELRKSLEKEAYKTVQSFDLKSAIKKREQILIEILNDSKKPSELLQPLIQNPSGSGFYGCK